MRKSYGLLGLLLTLVFVLGACAPATATPTAAPAATNTEAAAMPTATEAAPAPTATAASAMVNGIDCTGVTSGDSLSVMYQWTGSEEENFNTIAGPFLDACGVALSAEATRDAAVLDTRVKSTPPDILFWPSSAIISLYGDKMQDLTAMGAHTENYASFWVTDGTVNSKLLTLPAKADIKTIIWYSPTQFQTYGYTVPTTFDELNTLVEKMVADGNVPWAMGFESGAATGWTGSDFIQDLLLTQQGPDYVKGIIDGSVAYDDTGVQNAYTVYQKWASDPKYTVGGATGTVNTGFLDAIYQVFSDPPQAMMVKQSGFAGGEIVKQYPNLVYGTDFDFFQFPGAQGMQGGADYMFAFSNSPAASAFIKYLTSAEGGKNWAAAGFDISPNTAAAGNYPDAQLAKRAEMLANAKGFTPDIGDTLGDPFQSAEWKAIIAVVQGSDIPTELKSVAAAQQQSLGK
ncbi:MAG: ABC transporter substrate-binding protein [Anaerolineales bacterium]|jgi:alpha-glucoside transport system substrate-binding protein